MCFTLLRLYDSKNKTFVQPSASHSRKLNCPLYDDPICMCSKGIFFDISINILFRANRLQEKKFIFKGFINTGEGSPFQLKSGMLNMWTSFCAEGWCPKSFMGSTLSLRRLGEEPKYMINHYINIWMQFIFLEHIQTINSDKNSSLDTLSNIP